VNVAAKVIEQMFRRPKRLFGVDDPRLLVQLFEQVVEGFRIGQRSSLTWEAKLFCWKAFLNKSRNLPWKTILRGSTRKRKFLRVGIQRV